jgi:hypothetical protein
MPWLQERPEQQSPLPAHGLRSRPQLAVQKLPTQYGDDAQHPPAAKPAVHGSFMQVVGGGLQLPL